MDSAEVIPDRASVASTSGKRPPTAFLGLYECSCRSEAPPYLDEFRTAGFVGLAHCRLGPQIVAVAAQADCTGGSETEEVEGQPTEFVQGQKMVGAR